MRWFAIAVTALVAAGSGLVAGYLLWSPRAAPLASPEIIAAAQRSSTYGETPVWNRNAGDEQEQFRRIRDRAYAYCFRDGAIARACADEQDEAVHMALLSLWRAASLRQMPDKSSLGLTDRWIAENLDVEVRARAYCWSVYNEHGGQDARILGACLSSLGIFQPILQMPVFD